MDPRYLAEFGSADARNISPFQFTEQNPSPNAFTQRYPAQYQAGPPVQQFRRTLPTPHYQRCTFMTTGMNEPASHAGGYPENGASIPYSYNNNSYRLAAFQQSPQNGGEHQFGATIFPSYPGQPQPDASGYPQENSSGMMHTPQAHSNTARFSDRFPGSHHHSRGEAMRSAGTFPHSSLEPNTSTGGWEANAPHDATALGHQHPIPRYCDTRVQNTPLQYGDANPDPPTMTRRRRGGRNGPLPSGTRAHARDVRMKGACKKCKEKKIKVGEVNSQVSRFANPSQCKHVLDEDNTG